MNKKGFTVVELMTTFALVAIISILLINLTITLKEIYVNGDMKTALLTKQGTMTDKIYKDLKENKFISLTSCGTNCINFEYETGTKVLKINKDKKILTYDNYSIKLGDGGYFGTVEISNYDSDIGYILNLNVPIYNRLVKGNFGININHQLEDLIFDDTISFDIVEKNKKIICKRAVNLHTEECKQTDEEYFCSAAGYTKNGSKGTSIITYGNFGIKGVLTSGDAFDCDVNGDGIYNAENERFYYLTDIDKNTASLIYYNNTAKGVPDNTNASSVAYDDTHGTTNDTVKNNYGPVTAITNLPTTTQWKNVKLKNINRQILNESGGSTTAAGTLPAKFNYSGYTARLITVDELDKACKVTIGTESKGEFDNCIYLLENSIFSSDSINSNKGYWIENASKKNINSSWTFYSGGRAGVRNLVYNNNGYGVRPVIEVAKENIAY